LDDTGGKFATTPAVLVAKFAIVVVNVIVTFEYLPKIFAKNSSWL
jgi:hypothetical protein